MIIDELFEAPQLCPECGGISFSDLILAEKKDACYYKVKASAKVWPSAYASGRLVQCRKKGAANYGNKSEGVAEGSKEDMSKEVKAMVTGTCPHCHGPVKKKEHPTLTQYHCAKCGIRGSIDKPGVAEMDKSQTPPGRDGSNDPDAGKKEYTAKATTPKKVAKHGEKILNKVLNKKPGVAEDSLEEIDRRGFLKGMGAAAAGAAGSAKAGVLGFGAIVPVYTDSDPPLPRKVKGAWNYFDPDGLTNDDKNNIVKLINLLYFSRMASEDWRDSQNRKITGIATPNVTPSEIYKKCYDLLIFINDSFLNLDFGKVMNEQKSKIEDLYKNNPEQFKKLQEFFFSKWETTVLIGNVLKRKLTPTNESVNQGVAETRVGQVPMTLKPGETDNLEPEDSEGFKKLPAYKQGQQAQQSRGKDLIQQSPYTYQSDQDWAYRNGAFDQRQAAVSADFAKRGPLTTAEGDQKKPKEAEYGPEYDDMVARVKKLAGLGPMKTVYDPNKRVYRNMPTAVQPKK